MENLLEQPGQPWSDQPIAIPIMVETVGGLSPAAISRAYATGGAILDADDEPHDARETIDRMLRLKARDERRDQWYGQNEAFAWF